MSDLPIFPGRFVRVVKGRKVPHGTIGIVCWSGDSGWGHSVGFRSLYGELHFTAYKNVEGYKPTETEERTTRFFLGLVKQREVVILSPLKERGEHQRVSCRFCRLELNISVGLATPLYNHLRVCPKVPNTQLPTGIRHLRTRKPPANRRRRIP
jgi:hypothetical protein